MSDHNLTPALQDVLTNVFISYRQSDTSWSPSAGDLQQLREGIERALFDRAWLAVYLRHLHTLWINHLPAEPALSKAQQDQTLAVGLNALDANQLARLAIDPVALLALRAALRERDELPDHWFQRARHIAEKRRPLKAPDQIFEEIIASSEPDTPWRESEETVRVRGAAPVPLRPASAGEEPPGPGETPVLWSCTIPMDDPDQLEWLVPSGGPGEEEGEEENVEILLTHWPGSRRLAVSFAGLLLLTDQASCTLDLVDGNGTILAQARRDNHQMLFADLPAIDLAGTFLRGEFREGERLHVRFRTPLRQA
jgi:hypothetical protein